MRNDKPSLAGIFVYYQWRVKYMYPILLKMTGAGGTIKDQIVISAAATKGGAPLIRWTNLAHVKW